MTTGTQQPPLFARRDGFDPLPELERLRAERPVTKVDYHWGVQTWLVTRYEDVRMILGDHKRFTSAPPPYFAGAGDGSSGVDGTGWFIVYNPPAHTRLRRMLAAEFTKRRLARLEPRIEATVTGHLDEMERTGAPAELVSQFALRLPMLVICELFGVPFEGRTKLLPLSSKFTDFSLPVDERKAATERAGEIMVEFVRQQRADPGEGMLGMLIREHGDELTDRELAGVADLMVQAGYETTMSMLSLGTLVLLRHPEHVPLLFGGDQQLEQVIEELLRYLSITHNLFPRIAQEDVTISGQPVKAGELLMCSPPIANRDEQLGEGMDSFDPARKPGAHLAFGHGIHHCIGAPLARLELRMALPALFRRFPGLRLAVPFEEIAWRPNTNFYGLDSLPVAW
ncbi:cytochrome P450 [Amycolatopsis alkalitolerans]|uniref:Cytochrome P450 n=1 Tax=Amycolatopsis alkalitolerans TaxID=2547244 RepID=A0A5C4M0Y3_9PSEU|nr:cytochrome P450 [Amycolatopsis alkalitolerans]TNC24161.1 cytochrome P450 [Amycolatopsis alkalitolerans]